MPQINEKIKELDSELVSIIQDFLFLTNLNWPKEAMRKFLRSVEKKNLKLPKFKYQKVDYSDKISSLEKYLKKLGNSEEPAIKFLRDNAESYLDAYRILQGIGTKDVTEFSKKIYGEPKDILPKYRRKNVEIAQYFLRIVDSYNHILSVEEDIYSAKEFKKLLMQKIKKSVDQKVDPILVTVDSNISARAAAGSNYVKIRKGARFSQDDLDQLFHHEIMTHTITYINGRKQPILKILGYNSPRTTATQEGLAVFSEYVNLSIELSRLKRIALRIVAIDMAERGANFIDVYKFFNENGQNIEESYYSAMRIFRGGHAEGGIIFYKDVVYLKGLIEVESFLKQAMHRENIEDIEYLFCGKLTTQDVVDLKQIEEQGLIEKPFYLPDWAKKKSELASHLVINDLTERFK